MYNILVLDQKISAFKKSRIVVYVDEFGKPLKAEAQARKYFKSAKISCVFK
ncbi:hypothetical protein [Bdellovibrio sp. HCB209]|uniref:hypothetical protein n=1 Tax=Bdellovibrio sp. HCB209 TaxID=3394354 RepID=UPI0039B4D0A3